MRRKLVEICGVNTANLKTFTEEEKRELLARAQSGDKEARDALTSSRLYKNSIQSTRALTICFRLAVLGLLRQ